MLSPPARVDGRGTECWDAIRIRGTRARVRVYGDVDYLRGRACAGGHGPARAHGTEAARQIASRRGELCGAPRTMRRGDSTGSRCRPAERFGGTLTATSCLFRTS